MTTAIQIYDMKDVDEQLLATVPEEKWLPIPYWKDAQAKWLPLFYIAQSKNTIGLARNGRWFAIAENGYIQELTAALTIQWLVLLHEPLDLVTKQGEIYPIFGRDLSEFLHNWEIEHKLACLYPDGVVDANAIDQIRIEYLKELERDDLP